VNDILDTTEHDVLVERDAGCITVNVEDLGPGARFADWVVNALYPVRDEGHPHVSCGPKFATLRREFHDLPAKQIAAVPSRVLLTFGGTDPAGLAPRFAGALRRSLDSSVEIHVIVGPGAAESAYPDGVSIRRHVRSMAAEMMGADLILTSAGRTVYEAAATGTPVVVAAQNAREATHAHIGYESGVVFLGIGSLVDDSTLCAVVQRLLDDNHLRVELSHRLRGSIDTRGAERIAHRIRAMMRGL
jgi:spore coat polysaccharide biosynthesis predicted glycosyltransferase SpsG